VLRLTPLLLLLLAISAASAEEIWLRGRGDRVWIEKDGQIQAPKKNRKGFTRISTPTPAPVRTDPSPRIPRSIEPVIVLDAPDFHPSYSDRYRDSRWRPSRARH
jgi:hypothetical protein